MYNKSYQEYQLKKRSWLRELVRNFYLKHIVKYIKGATIDFGCGVGELLSLLPPGSVGYDVNKAAVDYCKSRGLDVRYYNPETDDYRLEDCETGKYYTFIMSHVLEHIDNAADILKKLLYSCNRLGVKRIIVNVPGKKGFKFDKTHKTFLDYSNLLKSELIEYNQFKITKKKYFPVNSKFVGLFFTHNQMMVIYDKKSK